MFLLLTSMVHAEPPQPMPLWVSGAPGATGTGEEDTPTIKAFLPVPEFATGAAVVVCPGGGYGGLAPHEADPVAEWLCSFGVAGFVLRYRHAPAYRNPAPLQDAQRAIRTLRAKAKEWHLDPEQIGILGFSAGGHLASSAGTHFDSGDPNAADPIDRESCRPDFMILIYPVITFEGEHGHKGSRKNLLGENPSDELIKLFCNEKQVTKETPPAFLVHGVNDKGVTYENSLMFAAAMRANGIPHEVHLYENGPHGFGLGRGEYVKNIAVPWTQNCEAWLKGRLQNTTK